MLSLRNRLGIEDSKLLLVVDTTERPSWSACRLCSVVIFYSFSCVFCYLYDSSVSATVSCLYNNVGRAADRLQLNPKCRAGRCFATVVENNVTCYSKIKVQQSIIENDFESQKYKLWGESRKLNSSMHSGKCRKTQYTDHSYETLNGCSRSIELHTFGLTWEL